MNWYLTWQIFSSICAFAGLGLGLSTLWINKKTERLQRERERLLREKERRSRAERATPRSREGGWDPDGGYTRNMQ